MQDIIAKLTAKDDKYACATAGKIISESQETDEWYEYFDDFAELLPALSLVSYAPPKMTTQRVVIFQSATTIIDNFFS